MQLTASKPAVYAWSVCPRERIVRGMHGGLAAADLVSRYDGKTTRSLVPSRDRLRLPVRHLVHIHEGRAGARTFDGLPWPLSPHV